MDWVAFWEAKAGSQNDFQATGRSLMDVPGFLHTVAEVVRLLELKQGEVVADVGCGAGLFLLSLSPWLLHIDAIDVSPALIDRARRNLSGINNVNLQIGSITYMPFRDASVNKLLAYSVLQYLGNEASVRRAMREVARVLMPGGRAMLAANPDPSRRVIYESVVQKRSDKEAAAREIALLDDVLWLSGSQLIKLAKEVGLLARVEPISERIWQHFYMFDLILDKPL